MKSSTQGAHRAAKSVGKEGPGERGCRCGGVRPKDGFPPHPGVDGL